MNILEKFLRLKNLAGVKNLNELAREKQKQTVLLIVVGVMTLVVFGWILCSPKTSKKPLEEVVESEMVGTLDSQFNMEASQKALETQQRQIKELTDQLTVMNTEMLAMQQSLGDKNSGEGTSEVLQARVAELEARLSSQQAGRGNGYAIDETGDGSLGIAVTNFSYNNGAAPSELRTAKNYVPPGTFAQAVLLSGADTNAGVNGQSDTTPITMKILDDGTLPNGEKSSLQGCFVTAAAYGDASSERGQIRLQRLACIRKPGGQILDIPIEGTINDMGGTDGVRGNVVMRNNKLIWNAGISGMLSGFGSAMQQSNTTQALSPLGITSSVKSGKTMENGAYNGASAALSKLADYYIKMADMYHPVVQLHAGSKVNIVFLKGFSLLEGLVVNAASKEKENGPDMVGAGEPSIEIINHIRNASLGDEVSLNGGK